MSGHEIRELTPPREIQEAMNRQMSAERTRRAVVTEAEGDKAAQVLRAEGEQKLHGYLDAAEADAAKGAITSRWLSHQLGEVLPPDTTITHELCENAREPRMCSRSFRPIARSWPGATGGDRSGRPSFRFPGSRAERLRRRGEESTASSACGSATKPTC